MRVVASSPGLSRPPLLFLLCAQELGVAGTSPATTQVVGGQSQRVRPEPAIGPARGRTRWAGPMTGSACPPWAMGTAHRSRVYPTSAPKVSKSATADFDERAFAPHARFHSAEDRPNLMRAQI